MELPAFANNNLKLGRLLALNHVLGNRLAFGSVNANLDHYALAAEALARADCGWLERLISRRVPLEDYEQALEKRSDDVKVVLEL